MGLCETLPLCRCDAIQTTAVGGRSELMCPPHRGARAYLSLSYLTIYSESKIRRYFGDSFVSLLPALCRVVKLGDRSSSHGGGGAEESGAVLFLPSPSRRTASRKPVTTH
eukprot:scaffold14832_cov129-Isochrysis_galbana.AAC.5